MLGPYTSLFLVFSGVFVIALIKLRTHDFTARTKTHVLPILVDVLLKVRVTLLFSTGNVLSLSVEVRIDVSLVIACILVLSHCLCRVVISLRVANIVTFHHLSTKLSLFLSLIEYSISLVECLVSDSIVTQLKACRLLLPSLFWLIKALLIVVVKTSLLDLLVSQGGTHLSVGIIIGEVIIAALG